MIPTLTASIAPKELTPAFLRGNSEEAHVTIIELHFPNHTY